MHSVLITLALALSATAYQITSPSNTSSWTTGGSNTVVWQRVDTDPTNFTIVLTNEDRTVLPTNDEVLLASVDGTKGSATVNAPSAGWPIGSNFRVNFVQDANDINTIYAQSNEFEINASSSSSSSSGSSGTSGATSSSSSGTGTLASGTGVTVTATGTSPLNPTGAATDTSASSTPSANAAASLGMPSALMGLVVLLGAVLA